VPSGQADLEDCAVVTSTVVYTDGACKGNPGPGGWAWVVPDGPSDAGAESPTTNQRMEIRAAFEAVRTLDGPLEVRSDSTYVVKCFTDRWWSGWIARGWRNSQRQPVANRDLWEPFVDLVRSRGDVQFVWVKGHAGDRWNDLADQLAVEAATAAAGKVATSSAATASAGAPTVTEASGHVVAVLGHQPPELGGYNPNPLADAVVDRLVAVLTAKATMHDDLVVLTGLRLGAETLGAEAAHRVGVPFDVVLPYPDPDARWPAARRARFAELLAAARRVDVLARVAPVGTAAAAASLGRRDTWIARHAAEAILVWDGRDDRLARLHRTLTDHLGDDVWLVDPADCGAKP